MGYLYSYHLTEALLIGVEEGHYKGDRMSKAIFTGLYGMREDKRNEYVDDIPAKVRELLAKGVKIDVKGSAKTVQPQLTELMSFPLPEEEDEPKTVIRYGLKMKGGRKSFVSYTAAEAYYKKHCARFGYPMSVNEVEVNA